jgi:hypothetical protein
VVYMGSLDCTPRASCHSAGVARSARGIGHATPSSVNSNRRLSLRIPLAGAVVAAVVACASTAAAQQVEARTVAPPTPEHTPQGELMLGVSGAILLGLPYGASVQAAAASERETDRLLYVPVAGPWATLIERSLCRSAGCRGNVAGDTLPLVANGLAQAAGLALIMVAISTPTSSESPRPRAARATLHVTPASYPGGGGLAAFGSF